MLLRLTNQIQIPAVRVLFIVDSSWCRLQCAHQMSDLCDMSWLDSAMENFFCLLPKEPKSGTPKGNGQTEKNDCSVSAEFSAFTANQHLLFPFNCASAVILNNDLLLVFFAMTAGSICAFRWSRARKSRAKQLLSTIRVNERSCVGDESR
jgi:hypothetical protein